MPKKLRCQPLQRYTVWLHQCSFCGTHNPTADGVTTVTCSGCGRSIEPMRIESHPDRLFEKPRGLARRKKTSLKQKF